MSSRWNPRVTVAAVIEHAGRFLLIEEETALGLKLNTPAGHLAPGETPAQGRARDQGIVRALWMTPDEVRATQGRHRSPLVLKCIEDYLAGVRHPLDAVYADPSVLVVPPTRPASAPAR